MNKSLKQLITELRRELLAPIVLCRDAIISTNGDVRQAHGVVVRSLTSDLVSRTSATYAEALSMLESTKFDVERAFLLWQRDNLLPISDKKQILSDLESFEVEFKTDPRFEKAFKKLQRDLKSKFGRRIQEAGDYVSSLARILGLSECRHMNDALVSRLEQHCQFVSYYDFFYSSSRENTVKALALLNLGFCGSVLVAGFTRNPVPFVSKYRNSPPVVFGCHASQLPLLLEDVVRKLPGTAWLTSDEKFSRFFYIHTDGVVGKFLAADLIKLFGECH